MKKGIVILVVAISVFVSACGPAASAVKGGVVIDLLRKVEERDNGSYIVWLEGEVTRTYCTTNREVYKKALELYDNHATAMITYQVINFSWDSYQAVGLAKGCDRQVNYIPVLIVELRASASASKTMTAAAPRGSQ